MATKTSDGLYNKLSRYYTSGNEDGFLMEDFGKLNLTYSETFVRTEETDCPELLAQRIYGDARYWWFLCRFNGIIDPHNMPLGLKIRVPDIPGISTSL